MKIFLYHSGFCLVGVFNPTVYNGPLCDHCYCSGGSVISPSTGEKVSLNDLGINCGECRGLADKVQLINSFSHALCDVAKLRYIHSFVH